MLSKYWSPSDRSSLGSDVLSENKVNKATSPLTFDDEKAAARELEQIFASQKELQKLKTELVQERSMRLALEARCPPLKDRTPSEEEDEIDESEMSDQEVTYRSKRPCTTIDTSPRNNLDIIVRAIRQIEGDAFSRSATPTCSSDRRGTFRPISVSTDSSRVSPVTPVCASWISHIFIFTYLSFHHLLLHCTLCEFYSRHWLDNAHIKQSVTLVPDAIVLSSLFPHHVSTLTSYFFYSENSLYLSATEGLFSLFFFLYSHAIQTIILFWVQAFEFKLSHVVQWLVIFSIYLISIHFSFCCDTSAVFFIETKQNGDEWTVNG